LVFLLCFTFACQSQGKETAKDSEATVKADIAAIKALLDEWVQLYNAEDFDGLMSIFYAENPILMTPNVPVRKGKDAILLSYQKGSELNIEHVDSSIAEDVRVSGNIAVAWGIDTGTTTPRSGGEPVKYSLKWLMVFERQSGGTWKCIYEIWNDNPLAQQKTESAERELLKLEQDWSNADLKGDWAVLDRILAKDYILTDSNGIVWTKAQCFSLAKSGEDVVTSLASDDWKVRVYGDAAVVTARHYIKETFKGKDVSGQYQCTDTWIKLSGGWQCVATHSSRIVQK